MNVEVTGRVNQKARTRQAIVRAAGALLARGEKPSLDEIAAEARVSRATAYRYFPGLDALLSEAAVDLLVPAPEDLFGSGAPSDAFERLSLVGGLANAIAPWLTPDLRDRLKRPDADAAAGALLVADDVGNTIWRVTPSATP